MKFGFNNDTAEVMITGAMVTAIILFVICIVSTLRPIERSEASSNKTSAVYETTMQKEIELRREIESLRQELAKYEAETTTCRRDNDEAWRGFVMWGGIILTLIGGVIVIRNLPPDP